jgi:hypothetical protein
MATAHREDGFTFRIWSNDHTPPHVHAWQGGEMAIIRILTREVIEVRGMKPPDVVRAVRIVAENEALLLQAWRDIHGEA